MIAKELDGKTFTEVDNMFVKFIVTGKEYLSDKRFKSVYTKSFTAFHINLWNGRVWGITKEGKRKLLKRVIN